MLQLVSSAMAQTPNELPFGEVSLWPWEIIIPILTFVTALVIGRFIFRSPSSKKTMPPPSPPQSSAPLSQEKEVLAAREPSDVSDILGDSKSSWLRRLSGGLSKTRQQLKDNLLRLMGSGQKIDETTLEQIHEVLYRSDMGAETADHLVAALRRRFIGSSDAPGWSSIASALKEAVVEAMSPDDGPLQPPATGPWVILVVGVNGVGKTTSIGKLAARFVAEGKSVILGAGDTYRAAAIEQLQVWGDRIGVPVIKHQQGSDPASVAFDAVKAAKSRGADVLLIDTAGRLHNKQELMDELAKIKRVIAREWPGAPHETWLVIDATTGQNAVQQVKAFQELVQLSGLVVTKLDGTAKGGVIIGIKQRFKLPIRYIGVGEKAVDLKEFSVREYADTLFE